MIVCRKGGASGKDKDAIHQVSTLSMWQEKPLWSVKVQCDSSTFRISPAWEDESPGPNPESLKKTSKKSSDPRAPKVWKKVSRRVRKVSRKVQKRIFRDFSDSPRDFLQTFGAWGSEDFFEAFCRLLGFGPRDSSFQAGEILTLPLSLLFKWGATWQQDRATGS